MDGYDRELGNIQRGKGQQVEAENGKREPVYTRATTKLMLCHQKFEVQANNRVLAQAIQEGQDLCRASITERAN